MLACNCCVLNEAQGITPADTSGLRAACCPMQACPTPKAEENTPLGVVVLVRPLLATAFVRSGKPPRFQPMHPSQNVLPPTRCSLWWG